MFTTLAAVQWNSCIMHALCKDFSSILGVSPIILGWSLPYCSTAGTCLQ